MDTQLTPVIISLRIKLIKIASNDYLIGVKEI